MKRVILLLGLLWAGGLGATTMVPLPLEQLSLQAEAVVHGVVRRVSVQRDPTHGILTRVQVEIRSLWKGKPPADGTFEFVARGGVLGNTAVTADAHIEHGIGHELVLYLVRSPSRYWVPVGMAQGVFRVTTEPGTGQQCAWNVFWGDQGHGTAAAGKSPLRLPMNRPIDLATLRRRTLEVGQ
jgi:hypothetical protein